MNELTPLGKAEAAAREAATDTVAVQLALAAVELAKAATAQQQTASVAQQATVPFDARKWVTIGGLAIAGGGVACFLAMAAALLAVAVAIGGVCATVCLIVLRGLWRDYLKGR